MNDAFWYLISAVIASPVLMSVITSWVRRAERREDWRRQDQIAARVAEVASRAERTQLVTDQKLDEIHVLVNSGMTRSLTAELEANEKILALLLRLSVPTAQDMKAVSLARVRIQELTELLAHRLSQFQNQTPPKGVPIT